MVKLVSRSTRRPTITSCSRPTTPARRSPTCTSHKRASPWCRHSSSNRRWRHWRRTWFRRRQRRRRRKRRCRRQRRRRRRQGAGLKLLTFSHQLNHLEQGKFEKFYSSFMTFIKTTIVNFPAAGAVALSVKHPELRSFKEIQLSQHEFDSRSRHRRLEKNLSHAICGNVIQSTCMQK